MRFQGSPVSTWPRANSATPNPIAKAKTLPVPGRQSSIASAQEAAKNSAIPPGSAAITKGMSQPCRHGSTRKASAIQ